MLYVRKQRGIYVKMTFDQFFIGCIYAIVVWKLTIIIAIAMHEMSVARVTVQIASFESVKNLEWNSHFLVRLSRGSYVRLKHFLWYPKF